MKKGKNECGYSATGSTMITMDRNKKRPLESGRPSLEWGYR